MPNLEHAIATTMHEIGHGLLGYNGNSTVGGHEPGTYMNAKKDIEKAPNFNTSNSQKNDIKQKFK